MLFAYPVQVLGRLSIQQLAEGKGCWESALRIVAPIVCCHWLKLYYRQEWSDSIVFGEWTVVVILRYSSL